jgi:TP901 family phage tail tape measure protein
LEKIGLVAVFDVRDFNRGLTSYLNGIGQANDATEQAEKQGFSLTRALEVSVGIALEKVAEMALKAAGAMLEFGKESIQIASEFESQLAILSTAAAESGKSVEELGDIAIAVGADSKVLGASASGAAEAMTGLYKAGLSSTSIFGDLEGYMAGTSELGGALAAAFNLAAATTLDVAQASDVAAVALATFGGELETDEEKAVFMEGALDNLVKAADASVAEVDGLVEALKFVGPTASQMGMSIEDTNNALALLSTAGIQGSMAGTSLGAVLGDLTKGTPKATKALEALGIELFDEHGEFRDLVDIVGQFEVSMADMTEEQKTNYMTSIFTRQGLRGMNVLMAQGVEGWNNMADATENATGIQEQAAARSETLEGIMEALDGQIETVRIQFVNSFKPALKEFGKVAISVFEMVGPKLEKFFTMFGDWLTENTPRAVKALTSVLSGDFQGALMQVGAIVSSIFGTGAANDFITFAKNAISVIGNIVNKISSFIGSLNELKPILSTIFDIVKTVVLSSISVIAEDALPKFIDAFEALKELNWEAITNEIKVFVGTVGTILLALVATFTGIVSAIASIIKTLVEIWVEMKNTWIELMEAMAEKDVEKILKNLGKLLVSAFEAPLKLIIKAVKSFIGSVTGFFEKLSKELVGKSIIPDMMDAIQDVIERILDRIMDFIDGWIRAIISAVQYFADEVKRLWDLLWSSVQDIVEKAIAAIKSKLDTWISALEKAWSIFVENIEDFWKTMWDAIKSKVETVIAAIELALETWITAIQTAWQTFVDAVSLAWTTLWDSAKTKVVTIIAEIKESLNTWIEEIEEVWATFISSVSTAWNNLWDGFSTGLATKFEAIKTAIGTGIQGMLDKIADFLEDFKDAGKALIGKVVEGINEVASNLKDAFSRAIEGMGAAITELSEDIIDFGKSIVAKIVSGIEAVWQSKFVTAIKDGITGLATGAQTLWSAVMQLGKDIVGKIKDGIDTVVSTIFDPVSDFFAGLDLATSFSGLVSSLKSVGSAMIDSIKDGIAGSVDSLRQALFGTVENAICWAFSQFGLPCPIGGGGNSSSSFSANNFSSSGSSQLSNFSAMTTPLQTSSNTNNVDNSRQINVEVNPTYTNVQSEAGIYYDVLAALQSVGA